MTGCFITVEGIDGAGKSTQVELLGRYLREQGYQVLVTHEPGGTALGESLREIVLGHRFGDISPGAELFLYAAARAEHVEKVIRPALAEGRVVLCDRFSDSTVAYQGYGRGLSLSLLAAVDTLATGGLKPDLTLVLDLPEEEGIRRLMSSGRTADRLEAQGLDFLRRLRQGYLALAAEEGRRIVLIRAEAESAAVFDRITEVVGNFLLQKAGSGE